MVETGMGTVVSVLEKLGGYLIGVLMYEFKRQNWEKNYYGWIPNRN